MATVTGSVVEITGSPAAITISASLLATNLIGSSGVVHQSSKTFRSANDGSYALTLTGGDYTVVFGGSTRFTVRVPDDSGTYLFANLITSTITNPSDVDPATVPTASNSSAGAVQVNGTDLTPVPTVYTKGKADMIFPNRTVKGRTLLSGVNDFWVRDRDTSKYHLCELTSSSGTLGWVLNGEAVVWEALEWARPLASVVLAPNGDIFFRNGTLDMHYLVELTSDLGTLQFTTSPTPVDYSFTANAFAVARTLLTANANLFFCDRYTGLYHLVELTTEAGGRQLAIGGTGLVASDAIAMAAASRAVLTSQGNLWLKDRAVGNYVRVSQTSDAGPIQFTFSDPVNFSDIV